MCMRLYCFFFKQKTAYEMSISDWSSDVCSSDLVDFGSAEFLLGIPAADVKAGDACGLFQHHASFGGLGRDDGGDLALAYERRAMCARGGIGEDQRHVLGSHIAAIGAISAASAAFDPANDLQLRSEEHTSELQSLMRISYAVFC